MATPCPNGAWAFFDNTDSIITLNACSPLKFLSSKIVTISKQKVIMTKILSEVSEISLKMSN